MKQFCQLLLLLMVILYACKNKRTSTIKSKKDESIATFSSLITSNIKDCLPTSKDTISKLFSVKYVDSVHYYTILLRIKDIKKVLDYRFNCSTAGVTVPGFRAYYGDWICLARGCGDHCEIFYLFKRDDTGIRAIKSFQSAYGIDLKNAYCVVDDKNKSSTILVINYLKDRCMEITLKGQRTTRNILDLKINGEIIIITYDDGLKQKIKFSSADLKDSIPAFVIGDPPPNIEG